MSGNDSRARTLRALGVKPMRATTPPVTAREWLRSTEAVEVAARAIANRHGTCDEQAWQTMSAGFREHFIDCAVAALDGLLDRMPDSEETG